jgi:REP element-mobilizing transposase RayT
MARLPGIPYHVTQRDNRRQQTFFEEELVYLVNWHRNSNDLLNTNWDRIENYDATITEVAKTLQSR